MTLRVSGSLFCHFINSNQFAVWKYCQNPISKWQLSGPGRGQQDCSMMERVLLLDLRMKGMSSTSGVVSLITIPFDAEAGISMIDVGNQHSEEEFGFELNFQTEVKASPLPQLIYKKLY